MNYELAKELKDARFPQEKKGGYFWSDEGTFSNPSSEQIKSYNMSYVPTLEKLIEACGDKFGALGKDDFRYPWYACSKLTSKGEWLGPYGHGLTPTEAVARLWLALQKQKLSTDS